MRAKAARRNLIERHSKAPRYIGAANFAARAHIDDATFRRWHLHGPVWVPNPAVLLGGQRRPGWTERCARAWYQWMPPYLCPASIEYLDTTQMCLRLKMTPEVLWQSIADHQNVDEPAMWLDGKPGWLPPLGSERN